MTIGFSLLPVALPDGCHGVRVDIASVEPMIASMDTAEWPDGLRDAAATRKADYLAGRLAGVEAVLRATGLKERVGRSPDGAPLWPVGVEGSISHHGGVACAVARPSSASGGLGIDIAPLLEGARLRAVVRRCLTPAERERLGAEPSPRAAALAFAVKEAIFKAVHPRAARMIGFDEAEVVEVGAGGRPDEGAGRWRAILGPRLQSEVGHDVVVGAHAWDGPQVYAVVALD